MQEAPLFTDLAEGPDGGRALWLRSVDGVRLRAAVWGGGAKGTVLLLPGRTEYVEKYGRAAASLAARGYATVTIDWRGQGLSDRLAPQRMLGHVRRFADYQLDLRAMLAALEAMDLPGPRYMLAHSMGGAIGLRALHEGLGVKAAVFTAPMWGIHIKPSLLPVAWTVSTAARMAGLGRAVTPGSEAGSYLGFAPFEGNVLTTDPEMYLWMQRHLQARPELALGGPSLHWLHEALVECRRLRMGPSPRVPGMTLLGSNEKVVDVRAIRARMSRWPGGRLEMFPGAEHEVLIEVPAWRERAFDLTADFFAEHR